MIVKLDKNNYFTGNYATIGTIEGGIQVNELPSETDEVKQKAYKYENGKWIFDEEKYNEILNTKSKEEIQIEISKLQAELNETDYKIIKCSECSLVGEEIPYNVTELHTERQAIRDKINKLQAELEA